MTDWTTIPNDVIEAGKPGRAVDGRALRDNPVAIAEGAPGAPIVSVGWYPYDMEHIDDGNEGLVWSFDRDGISPTTFIETPEIYPEEYEYFFWFARVQANRDNVFLSMQVYDPDADTWRAYPSNISLQDRDRRYNGSRGLSSPRFVGGDRDIYWHRYNKARFALSGGGNYPLHLRQGAIVMLKRKRYFPSALF
ncbi:hypothetical protein JMM63_04300 [Rhodovulum sulfidophilum]|uniref:hypothetical protein n=1 Tax=Rhodovulum sulfidophilum TaxID=35806 RepID=UPI001923C81C|nr:hypothetical protein [Rhodovulum sulfidophilum]MBL3594796.1 hypothetical protein [Rhodovulum sulfidophilum]